MKLYYKRDGERMTFSDKQEIEGICWHRPALRETFEVLLRGENFKGRNLDLHKERKVIEEGIR